MASDTQTEEQQFVPSKKKEAKDSKERPQSVKKGKKKNSPKKKAKKQAKKEPKKKKEKASKSKAKSIKHTEEDYQLVKDYMQKQNRPYSLINVYDNLHQRIRKPALQALLDSLVEKKHLTAKQYGKNKVYFLNQDNFQINQEEIDHISLELSQSRERLAELQNENKRLINQYRKVFSEPTNQELQAEINELEEKIEKFAIKKNKLTNEVEEKVQEEKVIKAEKDTQRLGRKLKKFRRIKKDVIDQWGQILEKKKEETMEMMGLDI